MGRKTKNNKPDGIYGFNIYEDSKGRIIYNDFLTKRAVYIPTFDYKQFSFYKYRYIIAVSTFIVLQTLLTDMFKLHFMVPIAMTLAVYIFLEFKFHSFLREKQPVKHFNKSEYKGYLDILNTQDPTKMLLKAVLYIALGVLLVLNGYDKQYTGFTLIFCWGIMAVCCFYALLQFVAFSKRKK